MKHIQHMSSSYEMSKINYRLKFICYIILRQENDTVLSTQKKVHVKIESFKTDRIL